MEEYVKEAEEVCFDKEFGEAYDKEWALRDQEYKNGVEEGIRQGIEQGSIKEKQEIAKSMLKENICISIISKCTGLAQEEIEKLK